MQPGKLKSNFRVCIKAKRPNVVFVMEFLTLTMVWQVTNDNVSIRKSLCRIGLPESASHIPTPLLFLHNVCYIVLVFIVSIIILSQSLSVSSVANAPAMQISKRRCSTVT